MMVIYNSTVLLFNQYLNYMRYHIFSRSCLESETKWWENSNRLKDIFMLKINYPDFYEVYENVQNEHKNLLRRSKKNYYQKKISDSNPIKTTWLIVSDLTGKVFQLLSVMVKLLKTNMKFQWYPKRTLKMHFYN